jgi:CspA family cold shock protein
MAPPRSFGPGCRRHRQDATKGYGFVQPDSGGKDVFVHISAVEKAGFTSLAEGAKVSFEVVANRG